MADIDPSVFELGPRMTLDMNEELMKLIEDEAIKHAVFDMNDFKSPGPDGYNSCFYKKSWSITGNLICATAREFQRSGKLL